ncbi:LysR family transcriptional regulator [Taklimakanibacter lacteus]|uniref:LysR family transcriptional regulator n=1 Tax=Taklimakanibacter lacteus TaxID=2268456 RepID=UPI000E6720CA
MDKLAAIRAFVSVAEEGGFTAAAQELGLSKSAASRQIAALEEALGAQLLKRSTRSVTLTDSGYAYLERCRAVLGDLEEADRAIAALQNEPKGLLRINAPMSFGISHAAPAIADFMNRYPDLQVALILNDRFVDPYDEGFDVTLRIGELEDSSLAARKLAQIEMGLFASPSYVEKHGRPRGPDDLRSHWALHYGRPTGQIEWALRGGASHSVPIRYRLCSNNGDALRIAAASGLGIALIPAFLVRDELRSGALIALLDGFEPRPIDLYAIYPPTRFLAAKVRLFIDFLAERFARAWP